jgi:hypothetical protein
MARTIDEIQQTMIDAIAADPILAPVSTDTSKTARWRVWTRIVATCAWVVETLYDTFKGEVNEIIAEKKPHNTRWYASIAKDFQYGDSLPDDSDKYDNTGLTDDEVEASKIIKYSAVTESGDGTVRVKVAKQTTDLTPLSSPELDSFKEYMARVKDAGVVLQIDSLPADLIRASIKIYYDPLILDSTGARIDGSDSEPVQNAFDAFLKNLPFNGTFVLTYLLAALQEVEGVVIPSIVTCETKYGAFAFASVDVKYVPDAGYLRLNAPTDLTITFIAQSQL